MDWTIQIIPVLGMLVTFAAIIVIVLVVSRARLRRAELQAEVQTKLIDKFGSSAELVAFLQSRAGQDFVRGVQSGPVRQVRDRAAGAVRIGIIFSAIGLAFLIMWGITSNEGLAWPGVFMLILGVAYFASSYSLIRFSRDRANVEPPTVPPALQQ